ncbi:MAG: hypothetical protein WCO75_10645, partial [Planctomycetota bacterium]
KDGGGLIADLEAVAQAPKPVATAALATPTADTAVLDELVTGKPVSAATKAEPGAPAPKTTKAPEPPKDVDRSVIDDLLGGGGNP